MILHLGKPTPGDNEFYSRWVSVSSVVRPSDTFIPHEIEILVVDQYVDISHPRVFVEYPNLKFIISPTTGHTHLPKKIYFPEHVRLITLKGERPFLKNITSVSEFVLYSILRIYREVLEPPRKMFGKTVAIIGYGRIGSQVANFLHPHLKVLTFDKHQTKQDLYEIVSRSDIISIHLEENKETYHLIDKEVFEHMKKGTIFINTARSSVISEHQLKIFINNGTILAAALDTTKSSWIEFDNVIATNHIAGRSLEDRIATDEFVLNELKRRIRNDHKEEIRRIDEKSNR